jgi:TolB-like protein/Flp pilus assembly protein TadD
VEEEDAGSVSPPGDLRLDSWKEIAGHLRRGVTTAQRWEKDEGLPVHRLPHGRAGSVFAWRSELDAWWRERSRRLEGEGRRPETARLLVLPFSNLSGDPEQEYLADGLTEELIAQLAQRCSPGLAVIARTSAMALKGSRQSAREIAQTLRLDYLVEGSVRRSGDRVRITVQLIDARTEGHRWAGVREPVVGDLLALQAEVADAIAREIATATARAPTLAQRRVRRVSAPAYDLYLRGLHLLFAGMNVEAVHKSLAVFRQAIEADAELAPAYVGLAHAYQMLGGAGVDAVPPGEIQPQAREAALCALRLDDALGEAHTALGVIHWQYDWDWRAAERELRLGVKLSPSHAMGHVWLAICLACLGRYTEAIASCRQAKDIDPLSPVVQSYLVFILAQTDHLDEGETEARAALQVYPEFWLILYGVAVLRMAQGDWPGARDLLRRADTLCPGNPVLLSWLGRSAAQSGMRDEALRIVDGVLAASRQRYITPWAIANIYSGLGDHDRAFEFLERAYAERSGWLVALRVPMVFGPLWKDERFESLCRRVGI